MELTHARPLLACEAHSRARLTRSPPATTDIVVLGAGLGGVTAALEIKSRLRGGDRLTLISRGDTYHFVPSNPWVAVNWRRRDAIEVDLPPVVRRRNIEFHLVIATGPDLAFDEIAGLGPDGHTHSICHVDHAEKTAIAFERFCEAPGPIVVGAAQGILAQGWACVGSP